MPEFTFSTQRHPVASRGFTLVEMAIVVVIIGLIVGGILVGTDLVKAAQLRAQMKQVDDIKAASYAFILKYGCIPGDCKNATSFFSSATQPDKVTNGNGDGLISRGAPGDLYRIYWAGNGVENEWKYVFDHLAAAGMFAMGTYDETNATTSSNRSGIAYPACALAPEGRLYDTSSVVGIAECGVVVMYEFTRHYIRIGAAPSWQGNGFTDFQAGFNPSTAQQFDVKFDDGIPLTGMITLGIATSYQSTDGVTDGIYSAWTPYGTNSSKCANTAGTAYLTHDYRKCSMRITAGF